jgi:hypothetical protein
MKIAILGPPGVGKSKLANGLAKHYGFKVVDNYVQRLQKKTNLALGPWSSYSEHMMIAGTRMAAEEPRTDEGVVTVGSIIDTLTYAAVKSDVAMHGGPDAVREMYDTANAAMKGLALIYRETWDYHLAFHLGYSAQERRDRNGSWELALDAGYAPVVESFAVPYVYGLQGDRSDRLKIAKEVIDLARTPAETSEEERGFPAPIEPPSAD